MGVGELVGAGVAAAVFDAAGGLEHVWQQQWTGIEVLEVREAIEGGL